MQDLFVLITIHLLAAGIILTTKISFASILPLIWSLLITATTGTAAFALWLFANRDRPSASRRVLAFLLDFHVPPLLRVIEPARLIPQISIISTGMLIVAFAYAQYDKYGMLTLPMGLFVVFWWGYLLTKLLAGQRGTPLWACRDGSTGLLPLLWFWVVIPVLFSIGGWNLIDYGFRWQIPAWKIGLVGTIYLLGLVAWNRALSQQAAFTQETVNSNSLQPGQDTGGYLETGLWKYGRRIDYTLELVVLGCIALAAGTTRTLLPYLVPVGYLFYIILSMVSDECLESSRNMERWVDYCKRIRYRLFPLVY